MSIERIAKVGAAVAGLGAFTATLAAGRTDTPDATHLMTVGAVGVGAGALTLAGGIGAARGAEAVLRPAIARGGRIAAAIGAATLAGSLLGTVAAFASPQSTILRDRVGARSDLRGAQHEREALEREAVDLRDSRRSADEKRESMQELVDEARPATIERQVDDGRVDLVGARIEPAMQALYARYDRDERDSGIWFGEQQRSVGDRTFTIAPLVTAVVGTPDLDRIEDELPRVGSPGQLAEVVSEQVDRVGSGTRGVIDVDEADVWYDTMSAPGEHDITWDYTGLLDELQEYGREHGRGWSVAKFAADRPLLVLVGVDSLTDAQAYAKRATWQNDIKATAVVELPEGAPARYALASVSHDGELDDDTPKAGRVPDFFDPRIASIVDHRGNVLEPADLRPAPED